MVRVVIKVYRRKVRSAAELLDAIISASSRMGIHRIINMSDRAMIVNFVPGQRSINVYVQRSIKEIVSGSIKSTVGVIFEARDVSVTSYEYGKRGLINVYVQFVINVENELVIWRWERSGIPFLHVFGGVYPYDRAVELAYFTNPGNIVIEEEHAD